MREESHLLGNVNPFANNTYNLGSDLLSWKNVYASGTLVIGGALSATGDALSPAKSSFLDIGSETARWNRIHAAEIYLNGGFVMAYEANTLASSTRQLSLGLSYAQDSGIVVRELALTGSTYGGASTLSLIESPTSTLKVTNGSSGWGSIQAQNVTANGSVTSSYLEFTSASGSSLLLNSLTVANQSVCLANGTNCPAAATGDINWTYDDATGVMRNTTSTTEILIGASNTNTSTARSFFNIVGTSASSNRLFLGQNQNMDVVIGNTTSSGMNAAFQFSGNDLFVQGNIGTATSVYTNGAFVAGTGSTYFGNGFITKTDGSITVSSTGNVTFTMNDFVGIGTSTPTENSRSPGISKNTLVQGQSFTTVSTTVAQPNPQNVFVQGRYAYVVNDDAGGVYRLNIFDVSDPQYPISVGIVQTSSSPSEVFVAGRYAYVIASNRLNIFDVSNVSNPVAVSSLAVSAGIGTDVTYPSRRPSIYVER